MVTKARLYEMIEALPEARLERASRLLTALLDDDSVGLSLALAPLDDEPLTDEEAAAIEEAKAELRRGEGIPAAGVCREFGL